MTPRLSRGCALLLATVLASVLAGCASAPQTRTLLAQSSDVHEDRQVELVAVPFHPQERWQCGPAALATMLQWSGAEVSPEALVAEVYVPARRGSLQPEMLAATRRHGRIPHVLPPGLDAVVEEISAGHPVLVLQNLSFNWIPRWHYAVVIGFDLDRGELILRSGTTERQRLAMALFERTWQRGEHWAIVITTADRLPATADEFGWLASAVTFEQGGENEVALTAYQTALTRWPGSRAAQMGVGNVHFRQGDLEAAAQTFRDLIAVEADYAPALNNLAWTLLQMGRAAEARDHAQRALDLDPGNAVYERTLESTMLESTRAQ